VTAYLDPPPGHALPRLFCFHHAGGGSSLYRDWHRALSPHVSVWPVLLPGRERRIREPRFASLDALVVDLDYHLSPYLTEPHLFFGHSMGALVAYRLACYRRAHHEVTPRALLLSAYSAPQLPSPFPADGADDDHLANLIEGIGGLPADLPPDWRTELLAVFRDDIRLCDGDAAAAELPLECPFHLFGGDADPLVDAEDLTAWSRWTTEPVDVRILHGDHFYLRDTPAPLLHELRSLLDRYARPPDHVGVPC
jgi:surfactin synthase thioesterase subunit